MKKQFEIGEILGLGLSQYQCVKTDSGAQCGQCAFYTHPEICDLSIVGYCSSETRSDGNNIIFKIQTNEQQPK